MEIADDKTNRNCRHGDGTEHGNRNIGGMRAHELRHLDLADAKGLEPADGQCAANRNGAKDDKQRRVR